MKKKPNNPKSQIAVTGLYIYDNNVVDIAKDISPSERGELEISTLNQVYLDEYKLNLKMFGRGMTWLDAGTPDSLAEAGEFVKVLQKRQGLFIACLEEIAWRNGWISLDELGLLAESYGNSDFRDYILNLISKGILTI